MKPNVLLLGLASLADSHGLEAFVPGLNDAVYQRSHDRRHGFCGVELKQDFVRSFEGHEVSVVVMASAPFLLYDQDSGRLTGGLLADVFEEVARRTGLKWREKTNVVGVPNASKGETYDSWLNWATQHYDIVIGDFAGTTARTNQGYVFAYPILNESPQLVGQVKVQEPSWYYKITSFLRPFTGRLWLATIGVFLLTALAYSFLETKEYLLEMKEYVLVGVVDLAEGDDEWTYHAWMRNWIQALYLTIAAFVAGGIFRPHTRAGKVFVLSWSMVVLVMVSSYTANMAGLLVLKGSQVQQIRSIHDAVKHNLPVCVYKGGAFDAYMQTQYPGARLVYPQVWGYDRVRDGTCVAMIKDRTSFDLDKGKRSQNPDCDLDFIGEPLNEVYGSFVYRENQDLCTAVLFHVINAALHAMSNENVLREMKSLALKEHANHHCEASTDNTSSTHALDLEDLIGLFCMHGCLAVVLLLISFGTGESRLPSKASPSYSRISLSSGTQPELPSMQIQKRRSRVIELGPVGDSFQSI